MNSSHQTPTRLTPRRRRPSSLAIAVIVSVLVLAASLTAIALAASTTSTVSSATSSTLGGQIVVNARGRTLYVLSPETTHHLLCKGACLTAWPPLTVSSRKTKLKLGAGVHGMLGILRRSSGMLQVTLRGLPLYRYAGDTAAGQTNGQGIHSFGGIWHAVISSGGASTAPAASTPNSTTAPGGYGEPAASSTPTTTSTTPSTPTTSTPTTTTPTTTTPAYPKEEKKEESW